MSGEYVPPLLVRLKCYVAYSILFIVSFVKELIYGRGPTAKISSLNSWAECGERIGYPALYDSFTYFYINNVLRRGMDTMYRPIGSAPAGITTFISRVSRDNFWSFRMEPNDTKQCINLASYNYLGFAGSSGPIVDDVLETLRDKGNAHCSPRSELGTLVIHRELEAAVGSFLGTEDAMAVGMGFATNALTFPSLVSSGCLVLSDEKNHASAILGLKISGATVKIFKHNDVRMLERLIRSSIVEGQHETDVWVPWKKVMIAVEGIYSMEGTVLDLPAIVAIKKKYGAYLYVDEAHSIGAIGPGGTGILGHHGVNPKDVDVLMGTFSKSFGSVGGYIAGSRKLVNYLRAASHSQTYASSISPPMAQQVMSALNGIAANAKGRDGLTRSERLARNVRLFRKGLGAIGVVSLGDDASPVVPVMMCSPSKTAAFIRRLFELGIGTVGVTYPVVALGKERVRFCVSADHTAEHIDKALAGIKTVAKETGVMYSAGKK